MRFFPISSESYYHGNGEEFSFGYTDGFGFGDGYGCGHGRGGGAGDGHSYNQYLSPYNNGVGYGEYPTDLIQYW